MNGPFKPFTIYTYRYDIGTTQYYIPAQNKPEAVAQLRSVYGPVVRADDVHRASWPGWRI